MSMCLHSAPKSKRVKNQRMLKLERTSNIIQYNPIILQMKKLGQDRVNVTSQGYATTRSKAWT